VTTARALCAEWFSGDALDIAVAVGYGESGWFVDAVGDYYQIRPLIRVMPGDTLSSLARHLRTDWQTLAEVNRLADPDLIHAGAWLWNPSYHPRTKADPQYRGGRRFKWGPSGGPFQIRTLPDPGDWGGHSAMRDLDWLAADLRHHVEAAYFISNRGTDWSPWTIYRKGLHRPNLGKDFPLRTGFQTASCFNPAGARLWEPSDDTIYDDLVWPDWAQPAS